MEIPKTVTEPFSEDRVKLKVVEEIFELGEVLIKSITKQESLKPSMDKIIEEMGDVNCRMQILAAKLGIIKQVEERSAFKLNQIQEWILEKNQKNGKSN